MEPTLLADVDLQDTLFGNHPNATTVAESPTSLISAILPNVYVVAGLIVFLYLVFGGFMVVTSAGSEDTQKGKAAITNALLGFIIIFASYWIIEIIQIITGIPILDSPLTI